MATHSSVTSSAQGFSVLQKALSRKDPLMEFDWAGFLQVGNLRLDPEYIENVNIPGLQTASDPVFRAGTKINVATVYEVGAISLRLYEDVALTVTRFWQAWFRLIHKDSGDRGIPKEYKGYMEVTPTTPDGKPIARIKGIGVFPTVHAPLPFGHESNRVILDVELSCDFIEFEFLR